MSRPPAPIPQLRRLVDQLVEGRIHVVCKLDLRDRLHALGGAADGETDDALLRQGRVEDAVGAELRGQVHGGAEDAAEGDVFAEEQDALVVGEGGAEGVVDGLEEVHAAGRGVADVRGEGRGGVEGSWGVVEEGRGGEVGGEVEAGFGGVSGVGVWVVGVGCWCAEECGGDRS